MTDPYADNIFDLPRLRDRTRVFADRAQAGQTLAEMLADLNDPRTIVLAIPAGGLPVAAEVARRSQLPLDLAVVSKMTPRWNTEVGYGAVAFDGTVRLNEDLLPLIGLTDQEVQIGVAEARQKVRHRVRILRGGRPMPNLTGRTVVLIDDGLASGFTMQVAAEAVRNAGAGRIIVAVPTGHRRSVVRLAQEVHAVYCANIRTGWSFAVADAYTAWMDLSEDEAAAIFATFADPPDAEQ